MPTAGSRRCCSVGPRDRFVQANGLRLHLLEWPSPGRPVLFLHGTSHSAGVWAPLCARLAPALHAFALDLRGHGLSDKPDTGYDWETLRDDLIGCLEALGIGPALLVGHSRGGGLATLVACQRPDLVGGLVLYEPSVIRPEASFPRQRGSSAYRAVARRHVFASRDELVQAYRGRGAFARWREEFLLAYAEHGTEEREDGRVELCCKPVIEACLYEEMDRPGPWAHAEPVQLPALACYGSLSRGQAREPGAEIRKLLPRCEVRVIPEATHFGPMEQPETFEAAIRAYAGAPYPGGVR